MFETDEAAERAARTAMETGARTATHRREKEKLSVLKRLVKKSKSLHALVRPGEAARQAGAGSCEGELSEDKQAEHPTGQQDGTSDRPVRLGHLGSQRVHDDGVPLVNWQPFFCVLLQDEQSLTAYRSEEMAIFPVTPTRPRTRKVGGGA
ncbi:uncharacterized protein LOC119100615 [Pollicipes pollicipes]|uniref:uncharacterized protein LOC119100615 n=1 Tax=Pollicipes pollicipes TaxID=41117 RepID=UPI0018858A5F|nr:uncharacterized protein LOC119100615 [Pollicipes pollicipes]